MIPVLHVPRQTGATLSREEQRRIQFESIIESHQITPDLVRGILMPRAQQEELAALWASMKDAKKLPKNINNFSVELEVHESRHGFVVATAHYRKNELVVGFLLVNDDEEIVFDTECQPGEPEPTAEDQRQWLKEVWSEPPTVETRVAPQRVGPNEKCPCGSGKKYKRCCERKI